MRREKALVHSGRKDPPGNWIAPPGSNRSGGGGNEHRRYQTPLETLLALPQPEQYLREGLTVAVLQRIVGARSDTEAAQHMQQAKRKLFEQLRLPANGPWK